MQSADNKELTWRWRNRELSEIKFNKIWQFIVLITGKLIYNHHTIHSVLL